MMVKKLKKRVDRGQKSLRLYGGCGCGCMCDCGSCQGCGSVPSYDNLNLRESLRSSSEAKVRNALGNVALAV